MSPKEPRSALQDAGDLAPFGKAASVRHVPISARDIEGAAGRHGDAVKRDAARKILGQVHKVVAAVLGPRSPDVADVTQDAFVRAYRHADKFVADPEKPHGATAWVNKVALRTALDHRAKKPLIEPYIDEQVDPMPGGDPEATAEALHQRTLVHAMLRALDEHYRAILILFYWSGETQEEIAETLGLPLGTVKTRMRAAHEKIREYVHRG